MSRQAPHDLPAEQAVLGTCLLDCHAATGVTLEAGDFYKPAHQHIWQAIQDELAGEGRYDAVAVHSRLIRMGLAAEVGGERYLAELAGGSYSIGLLRRHVRTVADMAARRRLILELGDKVIDPLFTDMSRSAYEIMADLLANAEVAPPGESSWAAQDITEQLSTSPPVPTLMERVDGHRCLYPGRIHAFNGEPESGKTWLALVVAAEVLRAGKIVVWVGYEGTANETAHRLAALGVSAELGWFRWVSPEVGLSPAHFAAFDAACADATLVVFDGLNDGMGLHGLDSYSNPDVAAYHMLVTRRAARWGACVIVIDHVTKNREQRGRWAIGAQHKLAAIDVAYMIEARQPFGKGLCGHAALFVAKDRPGAVREFAAGGTALGTFELQSFPDGFVLAKILAPATAADLVFHDPTRMMEKVSRWLEGHPGAGSSQVRAQVVGKGQTITAALAELVRRGHVEVQKSGNVTGHTVVVPYRDGDELPVEPVTVDTDDGEPF